MIVHHPKDFLKELENREYPARGPACAKAVLMIEPVDFTICTESAIDNVYMNLDDSSRRATKCDLCGGDPRCVQMCMAGALHFDSIQSLVERRKENPDIHVGLRAVSDSGNTAP